MPELGAGVGMVLGDKVTESSPRGESEGEEAFTSDMPPFPICPAEIPS